MSLTLKLRQPTDVCAKLTAVLENGHREVLGLSLARSPLTIGRNPELCSYVISDTSISGLHCKIFTVRSPSGGVIVSCQDLSKNGIIVNKQRYRKQQVILMDGDTLHLPDSLSFECKHIWQSNDKASPFDPSHPAQKIMGRYIVNSQCLGSGSFATVHLAFSRERRNQVACKIIKVKREHDTKQVLKEIRILMRLSHPNINRIYDTWEENDGKFIHIFLQLCTGGDLFTYINSFSNMNSLMEELEAKYIMYQLLKGLSYLHAQHISHRDLKPENILLYAPGPYPRILIADFGLARPNSYQETLRVCGTVSYLPPEAILALDVDHLGYVGIPSDMWSSGIILYIMLSCVLRYNVFSEQSGMHPFDFETHSRASCGFSHVADSQQRGTCCESPSYTRNETRLKTRILNTQAEFPLERWAQYSEAKALISSLLVPEPSQRADVNMALQSRWIQKDREMLKGAYQSQIINSLPEDEKDYY